MIIDFRMSEVLSWTTVNLIHDATFGNNSFLIQLQLIPYIYIPSFSARDTILRVVKALSLELPVKNLKLTTKAIFSAKIDNENNTARRDIHKVLADFRSESLGKNYLVIVAIESISAFMEVVSRYKISFNKKNIVKFKNDYSYFFFIWSRSL